MRDFHFLKLKFYIVLVIEKLNIILLCIRAEYEEEKLKPNWEVFTIKVGFFFVKDKHTRINQKNLTLHGRY